MSQTQAVLNNDVNGWKAAKARRERERHYQSMCKKIENLEKIVEQLQTQIEEISKK
jgi:hypothetical protein